MYYEKSQITSLDGKEVVMWHRSACELLQFHIKDFNNHVLKDVKWIEIYIGSDHGQGSYVFTAIILIRHEDTNKETCRVEVKLGETHQEKDELEHLKPLIKKYPLV